MLAIAIGKGGALEAGDRTGQCRRQTDDWLFYGEQTVPAMIDALEGYGASKINPADCGLSEKL
jgi:hypothetical protein